MHILISNDDGYFADGIKKLAVEVKKVANISVVAPSKDCSGASHSLTLDRPLKAKLHDDGFYSIDGTPTDCVHLGITGFLQDEPDMVVSGINAGANMGDDVLYSGTVAAAIEGRFLGLPAIALSIPQSKPQYYETAAKIAVILIEKIKTHPLPSKMILNVNIPDLPFDELKGIISTRLGQRHKSEPMISQLDPRGRQIYWIGPPGAEADAGEGTDFYAVNQGYVSVTPLQIDLTQHNQLDTLTEWLKNWNSND